MGAVPPTRCAALPPSVSFPDRVEMSDGSGYSGLDSFGRVIETLWKKGPDVMQKASDGYDRASNRKWRREDLAHDLGADPRGNWQKYGSAAESNLQQTRCHNAANEITQVTHPGGVIQPAYDEVGNQTLDIAPGDWDRGFSLKWDAWNRLIEVKDGNTLIQTNAYDGLSRRITSGAGTDITHYYYNDAWRAVEEYTDADPDDPACRYLWGLRSRWDLVKRERSDSGSLDEKRYVLHDAMDPVAICDEDGEVVQRFEYSPFGRTTFLDPVFEPDAPGNWTFLFHGEFRDSATGYYNYGFRFYNDTTGRWPSRDPIGERGGMNIYGFVGNESLNRIDRLGLELILDPWGRRDFWEMNRGQGGSGETELRRKPKKPAEISETDDKKCAEVVKGPEVTVRISVFLIDDPLGQFVTKRGFGEAAEHEGRRAEVGTTGYYATYDRVETALATKCGVIKRDVPGAAKAELEEYVKKLSEKADKAFIDYYDKHNARIDMENYGWILVDSLSGSPFRRMDHYSWKYDVPDEYDGDDVDVECPR